MKSQPEIVQSEKSKDRQIPTALPDILRQRAALKKELLARPNLIQARIAILGGSTTTEVKNMLELFLLAQEIEPLFYESGYNRYYDDIQFKNPDLWNFKPDIIFLHTTWRNISEFPEPLEGEAEVEARVDREFARFEALWNEIHTSLGALVIQNNLDLPVLRPLGNLEASESFGRINFLLRLNAKFANYARNHSRFLINDIFYLSAEAGLNIWYNGNYWYNFHMAISPAATVALGRNLAGMIKAVYGKSKKCLILDLDNTLWGGVVGDDGVQNLILGRDHPIGEAYCDFQRYVKDLRGRGIMLAVCSKNDPENAREGFSHPDSILKVEDFSAFKANWNSKHENICEIAAELNIGLDSIVFVDDNPAERTLVASQLPEVAVPDIGSDISCFAKIIEQERYFELDKLVPDDLSRAAYYRSNADRSSSESAFANYDDFLASLEMAAEIGSFRPVYFERIAQLINKTNQFNLTTRRYTTAEVESVARDENRLALYGRLVDRFGDNGLVSVLIGKIAGQTIELDTWLMSCRVFNREMEFAMFDALVEGCQARRIQKMFGVYIPSKKNRLVAGLYESLGFRRIQEQSGQRELWQYDVPSCYSPKNRHILRNTTAIPAAVGV
jgi:FkbH-like protein